MSCTVYIYDDERKELFIIGQSRQLLEVSFTYEPETFPPAPDRNAMLERLRRCWPAIEEADPFIDKLAQFCAGRTIQASTSDADEGSIKATYRLAGSVFDSDQEKIGSSYNRWLWDEERDGWKFPK